MERRRLGRTGHLSTVVAFGAAAFYRELTQDGADEALELVARYGVNHIDIAPTYGFAELRTGPWLESRRDRFFLGCKTTERSFEGAWAELHRSLYLLRTDHFDLYQLHAITTFEELDQALAPGGAIEALLEARDKGLTRWLGITGHGYQTPAIFLRALERFNFDTVMFPLHPRLYADPTYRAGAERLLAECQARDVGVQIIKSVTRAPWGGGPRTHHTWYRPHAEPEAIAQGVRFALSQPGVATIPSPADLRLLPLVLEAAENYTPMSAAEQAELIEASRGEEPLFTP